MKLFLSFIIVLLSHTLTFADEDEHEDHHENRAEYCQDLSEFFTPLGQLVIDNTQKPPVKRLCRKIFKANMQNVRGKVSKAVKNLNKFIRITNKHTPEHISGPASDLIIAEAQRLIGLLEGENIGLPADPGEAGKATLTGIDSDNDGVRDDLQRYIALTHVDSEKFRAYMTIEAKNMQDSLIAADDPAASIALAHKSTLDRACKEYLDSVTIHSFQGRGKFPVSVLLAQVLNTKERSLAWLRHELHLNGQSFVDPEPARYDKTPLKQYCDFDPDLLAN